MNRFKVYKSTLAGIAVLIMFFCNACEKETGYEVLSGQIMGKVILLNYNNYGSSESEEGVKIVVEGSNPQKTATCDESGQFTVDNLDCGIYNFRFEKEGFCTHKIQSYQFVGGNKPVYMGYIQLYEKFDFQIDSLELTEYEYYNSDFRLQAKATISELDDDISSYSCRYYLSNTADVSYKNYISTGLGNGQSYSDFKFDVIIDTLKFPIGSQLYFIMYPASDSYNTYKDINTGTTIYTSLNHENPSEVVCVTVPRLDSY